MNVKIDGSFDGSVGLSSGTGECRGVRADYDLDVVYHEAFVILVSVLSS